MSMGVSTSCLLVRHQKIGAALVQDSDVGVRPHKPKLHHGMALLKAIAEHGISSCHLLWET